MCGIPWLPVNHISARLCQNTRVPKIVDHEQRRAELGAAVRRVVARAGVEGATVRAVAAEAGWSMGALRYYFGTQAELLDFAVDASLSDIPDRIRAVLAEQPPGPERARALLEQMLPLDEDRLSEVRVYLAFMGRSRTGDGFADLADRVWHGERHVCGLAIADLQGVAAPTEIGVIPDHLVDGVDALQVFVDGLSFLGASIPAQLNPRRIRELLGRELELHRSRPMA